MGYDFCRRNLKTIRRKLRNNPSPVEVLLWARLKGRALNGFKFRRQHSIGRFVVDFYCSEKKLAIEIDGEQHFVNAEAIESDIERQKTIERYGVHVLRFTGREVSIYIEGVLEKICESLNAGSTSPYPLLGEEGRQRNKHHS